MNVSLPPPPCCSPMLAAAPLVLAACLGTSAARTAPPARRAPRPRHPCRPTPTAMPPQRRPSPEVSGTVTFWNGYAADGDEIKTFTDVVVPAFNKLYPNVKRRPPGDPVRRPAPETGHRARRRHPAGRPPSRHHLGAGVRQQGALLALDEEMPDFQESPHGVRRARSRRTSGATTTTGCRSTRTPASCSTTTSMFQDAGITTAPATIDDFEATLAAVKELGAGTLRLRRGRDRPMERAALDLELRWRDHGRGT